MSTSAQPNGLDGRVRTMQIIVGANFLGAALFLGYASWQRAQVEKPPADPAWLSYPNLILGVALLMAVAYYFVSDMVAAGQRRRIALAAASGTGMSDILGMWYSAYQLTLIVGAALLEGAAVLLIFTYFQEGYWVNRMAAIGFMVILITLFPTRPGVERWIGEQQERLKKEQGRR